jgi:ankyrin repeat protein
MRDNSNIELCRALCQSFTAGPATPNATKSLPLHFASKRWRPNKELLKLLLKRNPSAASVFNEFGFLPLHCACSTTDDIEAVKMIFEAYPEAIKMKDRQVSKFFYISSIILVSSTKSADVNDQRT